MKKIIDIKVVNPKRMKFFYMVTTHCPYSCRYCPPELNEGKHQHINLDELETFFRKFQDRELSINLTGGECTTHPQFKDILMLAKKLNIKTGVDTNSVRTARFYKEVGDLVDVWNVTLHPSQHILDLEKIQVITDNSLVIVYVMMDPDHWETAIDWIDLLKKNVDNVKIIPLRALSDWGGADCTVTYTQEQEQYMLDNPNIRNFTEKRTKELIETHSWLWGNDSIATYDNGDTGIVDPYMILKTDSADFYGWKCSAGNETMSIRYDGSAHWANCSIKSYKHFSEIDTKELAKPVICNSHRCSCGADIRSSKTKNV